MAQAEGVAHESPGVQFAVKLRKTSGICLYKRNAQRRTMLFPGLSRLSMKRKMGKFFHLRTLYHSYFTDNGRTCQAHLPIFPSKIYTQFTKFPLGDFAGKNPAKFGGFGKGST
jgi:hypothetical protein